MVLVFLLLYMAIHHLNCCLKDSQKDISWSLFLQPDTRQNFKENVWCAHNTGKGQNLLINVVNVKQGCVQMDVSRATTQTSTSKPAASIAYIQPAHLTR
jgi:hypothetical protein